VLSALSLVCSVNDAVRVLVLLERLWLGHDATPRQPAPPTAAISSLACLPLSVASSGDRLRRSPEEGAKKPIAGPDDGKVAADRK
jgi:hypothetical protein